MTMFVKPAAGRKARWPGSNRLLSDSGENVPATQFWLMLLRNGDIVEAKPEAATSPEPVEAPEQHEGQHA